MMQFFSRTRNVRLAILASLLMFGLPEFIGRTVSAQTAAPQADSPAALRVGFANPPVRRPPHDALVVVRPGCREDRSCSRELHAMREGGIGGVEIQPVYPLELNDPQTDFQTTRFSRRNFSICLCFTAQTAHDLNLRVNLTLGSGWPYGGSYVPVTDAAGRLRIVADVIPAGADVPSRSFDPQRGKTARVVRRARERRNTTKRSTRTR